MSQFTVSESVPLRPDPDPSSPPIANLSPGDRIRDPLQLGDWSKVNATDAQGDLKTGWLPSEFLQEIVGQTVKLHPEPLSDQFQVVTGIVESVRELANWRKVRVTGTSDIFVGTHLKGRASAHEALVQVGEVTVHRDLNKDLMRTNDKTDTGLFGINQH